MAQLAGKTRTATTARRTAALLTCAALLSGASLSLTAQDVHVLQGTGVAGLVKTITRKDTAGTFFKDSALWAQTQTTTYGLSTNLLRDFTEYFEGVTDVSFEYAGNCVKRQYDTSGYEHVEEILKVYFPDKSCNDSQVVTYTARKQTSRTEFSGTRNDLRGNTFDDNDRLIAESTDRCRPDWSACEFREENADYTFTRSWTFWPGGTLKTEIMRTDFANGSWTRMNRSFGAQGWMLGQIYSSQNADRTAPYIKHHTFEYLETDAYGNWRRRLMYRVTPSSGKTSRNLEVTSVRTFTYY